jgi:NADPH:quinone reductase-like Zn-dependent oxidoreductase
MRAWQIGAFGGPERLELRDLPPPTPGPGEALVRVTHCGVNPIDRSVIGGRFDWVALPHTPGAEIVGVVAAVGPAGADEAPAVGSTVALAFRLFCGRCAHCLRGLDEACLADSRGLTAPLAFGVTAPGGYAEYVLTPVRNCLPLPAGLAPDAACTGVLDGVTAWHLVDRARITEGERVLVVGATGGVGLYVVQIARLRGARVAALAGDAERARRLREWGAEQALDYTAGDVAARVREWSGGGGVDVVVDPVGASTWPTSLAVLAPLGRYATCGVLTGAEVTLNLAPFYARQQELIGSTGGSRADLRRVLDALAAGRLRAEIWRRFPLSEAPAALAALDDRARLGKIVLELGA